MKVIFWALTLSWGSHRSGGGVGGALWLGVGRPASTGSSGSQAPRAEVSRLLAAALHQSCGNAVPGHPHRDFLWLVL